MQEILGPRESGEYGVIPSPLVWHWTLNFGIKRAGKLFSHRAEMLPKSSGEPAPDGLV